MVVSQLNLGQRITLLRKEMGMSQKKLAGMLKISPSSVCYWERGSKKPDNANSLMLAKIFDKPVDYFTSAVYNDGYFESEEGIKRRKRKRKNSSSNLNIAFDFINGELIYAASKDGYLTESVTIKNYDENGEYFVWRSKSDAYAVKRCSEYIGGKMYLVYSDSELKVMDLSGERSTDESSNFTIVGKLVKNISDVE